jgi:hypothetical protein
MRPGVPEDGCSRLGYRALSSVADRNGCHADWQWYSYRVISSDQLESLLDALGEVLQARGHA